MKESRSVPKRRESWVREFLRYGASTWTEFPFLVGAILVVIGVVLGQRFRSGSRSETPDVVLYCAQDQVFAEPLLAEFTRQTGVRVRPVFDSEAVKTAGLVNRILAERARPVCEVFWGNEELRTRQLESAGVLAGPEGWARFGQRTRRLVINTNHWPPPDGPSLDGGLTLHSLTNPAWRGRVSLAYPLFGTTATHLLALRQHWGEARWSAWCRGIAANRPFLEEGNSQVVRRVARGEAWIGLTDSDDVAFAQREGLPVTSLPLDSESLRIPNTVALIARPAGPSAAARRLFAWLREPAVTRRLQESGALEASEATGPGLQPDWGGMVRDLDIGLNRLRELFQRQ